MTRQRPTLRTTSIAKGIKRYGEIGGTLEDSLKTWWLYVLECQGGVLYTGIAKDVDARFEAHVNGTGAIFTRLNRPVRMLSKAPMATKGEALRAEYALKQVSRADKLRWCASGLECFVKNASWKI